MKKLTPKIFFAITLFFAVSVIFISCNKNNMVVNTIKPNKNISVVNSRLKFNSLDAFGNTIKEMEANPNVKPREMLKSILGEENYNRFENTMKEGSTGINVIDTLVEDPAFASVLNSKGEIEVENTVYRITPNGTFMYLPGKENKVDQVVSELEKGNTIPETQQKPYLYKVDDGIYRYATFVEARDNTVDYTSSGTGSSAGSNTSSNIQRDIETHVITQEGKFGFIASFRRYFDSRHRIKIKFSAPNFLLFTYLNVKVKFQKKDGIGIWSKTKCDKIVLGWDGITYDLSNPIPIPQNGNSNVNPWNSYENWAHALINLNKINKTYLTFSIPGFSAKQINITSNDVAKMYKAIFDWLKVKVNPNIIKKNILAIMPNPNKIILGKTEFIKNNAEKISKTFDFTTAIIGYNGSLDGDGGSPTIVPTKTIKVPTASVYGIVYYNNKWLGVRIEKK